VSALLDRATSHRVTLVSGPAGAGKTVACASWAAAGPAAGRVVWLTVDAGDQHDWFWAYVCAALNRVRPAPAETLRRLEDSPADRFPLHLVEAAQAFTDPVVLILDDMHEMADPSVLSGLDVLIRHAPPSLRLVMLARRPPALQLARLRVAGELTDIEGADLACTAQEADAYFAMLGMDVPTAERDEVLGRTEGWMAGLRLAAMRADPHAAGDGRVTGLAGAEPLVTEYLWDEVLAQQEPQVRSFLVRTSVVAELSGDLADALTDGIGSTSILARLSRDNTFVSPASDRSDSYRYHPLLREVLTTELRREFPHEIPDLLRRAAHWYAGQDRPLDSVRFAAAAEDWDGAARALAESGIGAVMSSGPGELESVLSLFPAERAAGDVAVAVACASARLWSADPEGAASCLESAARALDGASPAVRRITEPALAALRIMQAAELRVPGNGALDKGAAIRAIPGEAEEGGSLDRLATDENAAGGSPGDAAFPGPPRKRAAFSRGGIPAAPLPGALNRNEDSREQLDLIRHGWILADSAGARASTRAEHRGVGLLWFALGTASLRRWRIGEARRALRRADRQLGAGGLAGLRARARAWLALAQACHGELTLAQQAADAARKGPVSVTGQASVLATLACAQVSLARDDLMTARRLIGEVDPGRAGHVPGEPPMSALTELVRARILLADGDPTAARAVLSLLRDTWTAACPRLSQAVTVAEAEAALRAGDTGRARALLLLAGDGVPGRGDAMLAGAGLMLAEGDFDGALQAIRPYLDGTVPGTTSERISALLAGGIAHRRLGDTRQAAELVERALALAEPEAAYRVFLDAGLAARSAVTVLVPPTSRYAGFAGRVLERFDARAPRLAVPAGRAAVRLTDSERAVLRFLPSHMTNEEISQALFLSINTVKTHLRSAYRKLGVGSRREAIARGRQLGLLLRNRPAAGRHSQGSGLP